MTKENELLKGGIGNTAGAPLIPEDVSKPIEEVKGLLEQARSFKTAGKTVEALELFKQVRVHSAATPAQKGTATKMINKLQEDKSSMPVVTEDKGSIIEPKQVYPTTIDGAIDSSSQPTSSEEAERKDTSEKKPRVSFLNLKGKGASPLRQLVKKIRRRDFLDLMSLPVEKRNKIFLDMEKLSYPRVVLSVSMEAKDEEKAILLLNNAYQLIARGNTLLRKAKALRASQRRTKAKEEIPVPLEELAEKLIRVSEIESKQSKSKKEIFELRSIRKYFRASFQSCEEGAATNAFVADLETLSTLEGVIGAEAKIQLVYLEQQMFYALADVFVMYLAEHYTSEALNFLPIFEAECIKPVGSLRKLQEMLNNNDIPWEVEWDYYKRDYQQSLEMFKKRKRLERFTKKTRIINSGKHLFSDTKKLPSPAEVSQETSETSDIFG